MPRLPSALADISTKSADGDSVLFDFGLLSGVQKNDATNPRVRYHCVSLDVTVDVAGGLPLVALLDARSVVATADLLSKPECGILIGLSRSRKFRHGSRSLGGVAKESSR